MVKITLTESAWEDLDSITDYIAQDSLKYAQNFSDDLFDYIEQLKLYEKSGRTVPEFNNPEIRELIFGKYRIIYRLYNEQTVVILRIIHGAKTMMAHGPTAHLKGKCKTSHESAALKLHCFQSAFKRGAFYLPSAFSSCNFYRSGRFATFIGIYKVQGHSAISGRHSHPLFCKANLLSLQYDN